MIDLIDREKNEVDINLLSPLTWAYVGDSVYELLIRTHLINKTKLKPHRLHIEAIKYVKAKAQADILKKIEPNLTQDEKDIVKPQYEQVVIPNEHRGIFICDNDGEKTVVYNEKGSEI